MSPRSSSALSLLIAALGLACGADPDSQPGGPADQTPGGPADQMPGGPAVERPLRVYTVNYPLAYFAERIGGAEVQVAFRAPADVDPAFWSPEPEVVAEFQRADLVLRNGAGYARWLDRATLSRRRIVDTSAAFRDQLLAVEEGGVHSHGPDGDHSHRETATNVWLDPRLARAQARAIGEALAAARPEKSAAFRAGLAALETELEALDSELSGAARAVGDAPILFSHPVYQYLVARYALNAHSLHWEPHEAPSPEAWRRLDALLEAHPARTLFWEAEPLPETRQRLEGLGIRSVVYAPAANRPAEGDWLDVMRANVRGLAAQSGN